MLNVYEDSLNSNDLRRTILTMARNGNSVHIGCSFSLVEIVAVLYENFIRLNWDDMTDLNRDILALSKGHGVMALYACFKEFGWISEEQLLGYFGSNNILKGLSSAKVPGIEVSGGSLGHGFPVTVGMAFASKLKGRSNNLFCIVGDGEMNEGSMWEAIMFSVHHKLDNLVLIIDANRFQAMGETIEILDMKSLKDKLTAFGFKAIECNGHDRKELSDSLNSLCNQNDGLPKALIANTIKGKGISFMEGNNAWHYSRLNDDSFKEALKELSNER